MTNGPAIGGPTEPADVGGRAVRRRRINMVEDATPAALPPAPRTVRRRVPLRRPPAWAAGGFLFVGLSLLAVGSFRLYVAYAGTPVRATVDRLAVNTDNDGTTYRAEFHYDLAGRTHHTKATVSDRLRSLLHHADGSPGAGVVPARAVPLPGGRPFCLLEDGPLTWLMLAVGGAFTGGLLAAAPAWYVRPARQRRLLERGAVATGRVTRVDRRGRSATVGYAFAGRTLPQRQTVRGPVPAVGDAVTVVYDRRRNVAYEYGDYEVVPAPADPPYRPA